MYVRNSHYSRVKNVIVGILGGVISILFIYMGISNMREYGDCLWGGLFLLLLSILCIVYVPKGKEECSNIQTKQHKYDSFDGTISMEDVEIEPDEEEYEYVEVKSYVRRKKK